jgi:hypothetical protein
MSLAAVIVNAKESNYSVAGNTHSIPLIEYAQKLLRLSKENHLSMISCLRKLLCSYFTHDALLLRALGVFDSSKSNPQLDHNISSYLNRLGHPEQISLLKFLNHTVIVACGEKKISKQYWSIVSRIMLNIITVSVLLFVVVLFLHMCQLISITPTSISVVRFRRCKKKHLLGVE